MEKGQELKKYKILTEKFDSKLKEAISNMTDEEMKMYFPDDDCPKGWVSIEDHLPMMCADDYFGQGYTLFKVKDKDGKEFESSMSDHNIWYYIAKEAGITHWWNN